MSQQENHPTKLSVLLSIVFVALIGAAASKTIDYLLSERALDPKRFSVEFPKAMMKSDALAKSIRENPPRSAADFDILLGALRKHRESFVNDEARLLLLQDMVALGLAQQYLHSAEFSERQLARLKESRDAPAKGLKGTPSTPAFKEWQIPTDRLITVVEQSAIKDRTRAAAVISQLISRTEPQPRAFAMAKAPQISHPAVPDQASQLPVQPGAAVSKAGPHAPNH